MCVGLRVHQLEHLRTSFFAMANAGKNAIHPQIRGLALLLRTGRVTCKLRELFKQREAQHLRNALRPEGLQSGDSVVDLMADAHAFVARTPSALMTVQADDLWEETEPLNVPGTDRERANWRRRQHGGHLPGHCSGRWARDVRP